MAQPECFRHGPRQFLTPAYPPARRPARRRVRACAQAGEPMPPFRSAEDEARYRAAYDAALATWPVVPESRSIATRFGAAHVLAAGPAGAPPLILLHSLAAT